MKKEELTVNQSTQVVTTSFEDFKSLDDMLKFGETICKSNLSPLKTPQDVVAALLMGRELGMGVMVSINNIYPINGKASSGIHIIAGQLLKAGISYKVLSDYEPVFAIAIKGAPDGEGKATYITVKKEPYSYELKDGEIRGKSVIDIVTIIEFSRVLKQPDGSFIPMTIVSKFYKSDIPEDFISGAKAKDNYLKYENVMMYTRCFTNGSKRIADDVILGLYETSELADANNVPYKVEDGVATIIDSNPKQKENVGNPTSNVTEAVIEATTPNPNA